MKSYYDLSIIGGGINGAAIARDAAGRGLSVALFEQDDLASHTSSASTKLIHGGLRYLEHYDFGLVRKALQERERLLHLAPHLITPLAFVLPHSATMRPFYFIKLGLFIYDRLGGKSSLPKTQTVKLTQKPYKNILNDNFKKGFHYYDAWVDDSRLVVTLALDAHQRGADIFTRHQCIGLTRHKKHWDIAVKNNSEQKTITSKVLINAAGPWVNDLLTMGQIHTQHKVKWIKGSHIIVPRLFEGNYAYILQNPDNRIIFAIAYENNTTLIGTTDVHLDNLNQPIKISESEKEYLCKNINNYFKKNITQDNIIQAYSGVRALYDDGSDEPSKITRDYFLEYFSEKDKAPMLTVFGGKLTTHRQLAEEAVNQLETNFLNLKKAWTANAILPGGDLPGTLNAFIENAQQEFSWLEAQIIERYCRAYGTRMHSLLKDYSHKNQLGKHLSHGLYEHEVQWLKDHEWAKTDDDILFRRTKLGLK